MSPVRTAPQLQRELISRLHGTPPELAAQFVVVCPSISFPAPELRKITGIQHYEERLLFLTLMLRRPDLQLVYPTSLPLSPTIIDYWLGFLHDVPDARERLHLLSLNDQSARALIEKLLENQDALHAIRKRVPKDATSVLLPFNVTSGECRLSELLGIPLYGPREELVELGSKSGSRSVAAAAAVDVFPGVGDIRSLAELRVAIDWIVAQRPDADAVVAKLNNGFSGQGNVIIELRDLQPSLTDTPAAFCAPQEAWDTFGAKVEEEGAVVEELVRVPGTVSPSVQLRILPGGGIEELSTHDQILGGPDGQVYIGCRFPAGAAYRSEIQRAANRVARVLADRGVIGSFGIDFVVVPQRGVFLCEINLRLGGTTHPFMTARHVTGGSYDSGTGRLLVDGVERVYTSSDNVTSPEYVGLDAADVIAAVNEAGLAYDPTRSSGVTLHLMGALPRYGKLGVVCIAPTPREADDWYTAVVQCLDGLAKRRSG